MSSLSKVLLKVDWCSYKAAKYAVLHWHYSQRMPVGKLVRLGVWEDGKFVGAVVFGCSANIHMGSPYGLSNFEVCELVRIAMRNHITLMSRIIKIALSKLKKLNPGLRLVISYSDLAQNHLGIIYQAANFVYVGERQGHNDWLFQGVLWHQRALSHKVKSVSLAYLRQFDPDVSFLESASKHKYLYPLDRPMRKQILPLAKPYPKRVTEGSDSSPKE